MQDDWIGSSHVDVIDNTFLTIEVVEVIVEEVGFLDGPFKFGLSVELSHVMHEHSRSLVTLLEVVGNIGGFNDAIWLIASSIFCLGQDVQSSEADRGEGGRVLPARWERRRWQQR